MGEFKVAVEYDGQQHHTSAADQQRDADRREELRRHGWRVIAVRRDVIPGHIADLLHHVADALIERGWRPGPHGTNRILSRIRAARRSSRFRLPTRPTTPGHSTHRATKPTAIAEQPEPPTRNSTQADRRGKGHAMALIRCAARLQHYYRCDTDVRYGDYAAHIPAAIPSHVISIALSP
ncbi:DUF559 domain-containing protein [Nonomuraea fuscirosea]|uniref:DUF559 domain-containing protein n=1 Tax=Nonomuraea fuscirosea TaxID=1291556 RepID=UPI00342875B3